MLKTNVYCRLGFFFGRRPFGVQVVARFPLAPSRFDEALFTDGHYVWTVTPLPMLGGGYFAYVQSSTGLATSPFTPLNVFSFLLN